ncbi:MAG TPA: MmcQ/YjbR family DNA-binding protein [Planctomycetaceae bacterium]|nr:MmcQ/YjbR family DNA-binding protein [Planctomycetaceae bacterium]
MPGSREELSYGTPGFKVGKKLIARMHQTEDAIVIRLDSVEEQATLIASDPDTFYITDHYIGYAAILVRPTIPDEALFDLLEQAWRRVARKSDLCEFEARGNESDA